MRFIRFSCRFAEYARIRLLKGSHPLGVSCFVVAFLLAAPVMAQDNPTTWRDPETRCYYLKVGDTLSLRYRRDGSPDCASVPQVTTQTTITRNDLQDVTRAIDGLRRDIGGIRRELDNLRRDIEARR